MKKIITLSLSLAIAFNSVAQDEHDALRFAFTSSQSTARGIGIGNALGSIGADFATLSVNPAGIGLYRSSEFSITPSFTTHNNSGQYLGSTTEANGSKFNLGGFGFVSTNSEKGLRYRNKKWKAVSFGIGMNRNATFRNIYQYKGDNYKNSLIERYAEEFNGYGGLNNNALNNVSYPAFAAYQTYLIDRGMGADSTKAFSYVPYSDGIRQDKRVSERGHIQEYVISVGGNYMEQLMLGATLGINSLKYERTQSFSEDDISNNLSNDFKYMDLQEVLKTSGTGINLKLGAILKPTKNLRFGLAVHTPTAYELNDASQIFMESHTDSLLTRNNPSASPVSNFNQDTVLVFNYGYTTPYKVLGSATVMFNKSGFLTADVEFVDYASMRYNFREYEALESKTNEVIRNTYKSALNIRVGGEVRLNKVSLRAGGGFMGSPYKNTALDASQIHLGAGIGYRTNLWFLDMGYQYTQRQLSEMPYLLARANADVQRATINNRTGMLSITMGWKF